MKKIVGIYKITSPSGRVYIGQSRNMNGRKRLYKYLHCKGQPKIYNSIKKHGWDNHHFEIIHPLPIDIDQADLNNYEQVYLDAYRNAGVDVLNIREAGSNGKPTPESSRKMVETRRNRGSYIISEEARKKLSQHRKGKPGIKHSEATKQKLSIINKGRIQSDEAREKNRQSQLGRKHPEHVKSKIGDANKNSKRPDLAEYNRTHKKGKPGRKLSQETKDKIGKAHKGNAWGKGRIQSEHEKKMRSEMTKKWWEKRKSENGIS
jgi:group I intron endonuclease